MNQYILVLLWILCLTFFAGEWNFRQYEIVNNVEEIRFRKGFAFLAVIPLVWMTMNRPYYFGDTAGYVNYFRGMPEHFSELSAFASSLTKDPGFYFCSAVIRILIGNKDRIYLLIIALIQICCIISVFRKYSSDYLFSLFLFIASADYISWMFNGIRQFMAVTIVFAATTLMLKKKYISLILVILLASTFHQSALLMIPLVFIAQGKAWNSKTLLFCVFAVLAFAYVGQFTNFMDSALSNTQYVNVVSDYTAWEDDGVNPVRALIYSVPAVISFIYRKRIWEEEDPLINFCTNMAIVTMGLYIVAVATSGIFLGRLPIYTSLFCYMLLPWEISRCFSNSMKRMIRVMTYFMYIVYYLFQLYVNGLL